MTRLRYAVIGVGHLGKEHARIAASLPDVELVGVVDANPDQAKAIAEKNNTRAFAQAHELIGKIDSASIVVPTTHHGPVADAFLEHGIPLLIEKPLAGTLAEANRLVELARKHETMVQVGHIERFNPAYEEILSRPMQPKLIRCQRVGPFTGRSYDVGVIFDLMIHDLDLLLALVNAPVQSVQATGLSVFGGHEDVASARLHFANGCVAEVLASRASPQQARTMQIWGAEGFADIDFGQRKVTLMQPTDDVRRHGLNPNRLDSASRAKIREELFTKYLPLTTIDGQAKDQLTAEISHFADCVRTGRAPRVGAEAGRDAVALAERIVSATKTYRRDAADPLTGPHLAPATLGKRFDDERRAA
jgi:predicted dehydrogenase